MQSGSLAFWITKKTTDFDRAVPRSLLSFVIRDHLGTTPLSNLRQTLLADLSRIWTTLSKPAGLEDSKIDDYFDFAFVALPHKILQPEKFVSEVQKLGTRFREGYNDPKLKALQMDHQQGGPILLPEYHRRIPADGFPVYAQNVWQQIDSNKDLDLPTQQELLAQFRCDEIAREVLITFDAVIKPLEDKQASDTSSGESRVIDPLGRAMNSARTQILKDFSTEASRYHKAVFKRKEEELTGSVDGRLKALLQGQLAAAHRIGVKTFSDKVASTIKDDQKRNASYDFQQIVTSERTKAIDAFQSVAKSSVVQGTSWSTFQQEQSLFAKDLDKVSAQLRKDEMRRLATRIERWVRARLDESIGMELNKLGSGRAGGGAPETGERVPGSEKELWDRVWTNFTETVALAETRFAERAKSYDADIDEVQVGLWRLRRKSWGALHAKLDEEMMEGNLLLKLRENFEDKFRYDDEGVPRIWRPSDDIEGTYTRAKESTLRLVPILARFRLSETSAHPPLDDWIGHAPPSVTAADEDDLTPIGGVGNDDEKTLDDEMTLLSDAKRQDLTVRFKKAADGVYVEAKRSALGGVTQVPLYFYGLLLALGWNEIVAVLKNPVYFVLLALLGVASYVAYTLNLWGPMIRMANAASQQGVEVAKERLREFLESPPASAERKPIAMSGQSHEGSVNVQK